MNNKTFTEATTLELSKLLMPIKQFSSPRQVKRLFRELGFDLASIGDTDPNIQELITKLAPLVNITLDFAKLVSDLIDASTDEETAAAVLALAHKIPEIIIYTQGDDVRTQFGRLDPEDNKEMRMPLYQTGVWPDNHFEVDINLCPIPPDGNKNSGLALYPYLTADVDLQQVAELGQ